jgi:sugar-specific transcriptional regulator TrmB
MSGGIDMSPSDQVICARLVDLGFTPEEAQVYLALLEESPATGYEISKRTGLNQNKAYATLRALQSRAAVTVLEQEPTRYAPVDPDQVLGEIRRTVAQAAEDVRTALAAKRAAGVTVSYVMNLHGSGEVLVRARSMIAGAKHLIMAGLCDQELSILQGALKQAEERGVQVHVLVYGTYRPPLKNVHYHRGDGMAEARRKHGHWIMVVADSQEALTGNLEHDGPGGTGVWTANPSIAYTLQDYLAHDIYLNEVYARFGRELDEAFGPNLQALRVSVPGSPVSVQPQPKA